eukprot:jgi/Bigna1/73050/fgenesh1_pg.22_\
MRAALWPFLSLLLLAGGVEAQPSRYNCNHSSWSSDASFSSTMTVQTMKEDRSQCSISGLPQQYSPSTSYQITVQTEIGRELAYKLVVSAGSLTSGGERQSDTCRNMDQKVQQQTFEWVSPSTGMGTVTVKALCGDDKNMFLASSVSCYSVAQSE